MASTPRSLSSVIASTRRATSRSASTSSPESISSSTEILGSSTASWSVSARFCSPPENSTLTPRVRNWSPTASRSASRASRSASPFGSPPPPATPRSARCSRVRHHHVVTVDLDVIHPHGLSGGQGRRFPGLERERRAVLRALDLALVLPHVALRQGVVGVRARVVDDVEIVADAHDAQPLTVD